MRRSGKHRVRNGASTPGPVVLNVRAFSTSGKLPQKGTAIKENRPRMNRSNPFIPCFIFLLVSCSPSEPEPKKEHVLTSAEHLIAAREILQNKNLTAADVGKAESHLKAINQTDTEFKESQQLLKKAKVEEKRLVKEFAEKLRREGIVLREKWADEMERGMLRKGMDVHINLSGPDKTTVTLKYVLLSRPEVYQLQESNFFENLKKQGFKKAVLTDGYHQQWTFDLTK